MRTRLLHANDARATHAPSWYAASCEIARRAALEDDVDVDVCVVGGGYTGLAAAAALAAAGHSVAVLEAHRVGWGASGRNGGQLGSGFNVDQRTLARRLGHERAHALWHIAEEAKAHVRALDGRDGIDLQRRDGIVYAMHRARAVAQAHDYAAHLARAHGYEAIEPLDRSALRALVDSADYHGGTLDRGASHLHPLRLAAALARAAERAGATLYEDSEVLRIENLPLADERRRVRFGRGKDVSRGRGSDGASDPDRGSSGDPAPRLVTSRARVRAERVVLACNGYLDALAPTIAARVAPINNFIVVTEPLGARARALLPGDHAVADSRFVVNYFRRTPDDRLLFGGGESYGYRFPENMARRTRRAMLGVFPSLADARVDYAWGGTLGITPSRLPHVTSLSRRAFAAGGYSGHGVALAVACGRAIARAIDGDRAALEHLAALPVGRFPGGARARPVLLAAAMTGAAWLDRL